MKETYTNQQVEDGIKELVIRCARTVKLMSDGDEIGEETKWTHTHTSLNFINLIYTNTTFYLALKYNNELNRFVENVKEIFQGLLELRRRKSETTHYAVLVSSEGTFAVNVAKRDSNELAYIFCLDYLIGDDYDPDWKIEVRNSPVDFDLTVDVGATGLVWRRFSEMPENEILLFRESEDFNDYCHPNLWGLYLKIMGNGKTINKCDGHFDEVSIKEWQGHKVRVERCPAANKDFVTAVFLITPPPDNPPPKPDFKEDAFCPSCQSVTRMIPEYIHPNFDHHCIQCGYFGKGWKKQHEQ